MATPEELSLLDKLSKTLEIVGKSLNRSYRLIFGISALIILISTGIVEPTKDIAIEWINLKVKISILLILICSFLSITCINCYSLMIEHTELSELIRNIYKSYKLEIPDFSDEDYDYLEYPDILGLGLSKNLFKGNSLVKFFYNFSTILIFLCLILLPIASQILTAVNAISEYGYTWWIIAIFLIMFLIDIILISALFKKLRA